MENLAFTEMLSKIKSVCVDINTQCDQITQVMTHLDKVDISLKNTISILQANGNSLLSTTDIILKNELYHILGMYNLSASQTVLFIQAIKNLGKAHDKIKRYNSILGNIQAIYSSLTSKSDYKCKILTDKKVKI